ncbi:MAG: single-stranded DNA-binding protein [Planctomycetota bacterium]|nr:single-stranded DNA-binding protein [Planctomycetota bacterium]
MILVNHIVSSFTGPPSGDPQPDVAVARFLVRNTPVACNPTVADRRLPWRNEVVNGNGGARFISEHAPSGAISTHHHPFSEHIMIKINNIKISGRLVEDPTLKDIPNGVVVNTRIANDDSYVNRETKEKIERTHFVDITAYGPQAKGLAKAKKGTLLYIDGKIRQESWTKDDKKMSRLIVEVNEWQFAEPPRDKAE